MGAKLEEVLSQIDSGPYTWIIFFLTSIWGLFGAMQALSAAFLSYPMDHWCHVPELDESNWTVLEKQHASIPWESETGKDPSMCSCEMYDRNYSEIASSPFYWEDDLAGTPQVKCSSWEYNTSVMHSTVVSEWDLVCDRAYLRSLTQSVFMFGVLLGSPMNGILADKFGRKKILSLALFVFLGAAAMASAVPWYSVFLVCRFIIAFTGHCVYQTSYIIAIEAASIRHRGTIGVLFSVPFAFGNILLPGIAYFVRDWRYLNLAISLPVILLAINAILLPESPRWLIQKGKKEEAIKELQKAAKWNGKKPFDPIWLSSVVSEIHESVKQEYSCKSRRQSSSDKEIDLELTEGTKESTGGASSGGQFIFLLRKSALMCRITFILCFVWVTCVLVYYGISLNAPNLSADPFLYMAIGGAVEVPCYVLGAPIVKKIGRKKTIVISLLITGIAVLGPIVVTEAADRKSTWFLTITMLGKMSITTGFQVLYLYTSELYPTSIRTQGLGVTSMVGRIGAIISPFINDTAGPNTWYLPSVIYGVCSVATAVLTCLLPETMARDLPDTVMEMQQWEDNRKANKDGNRTEEDLEEEAPLKPSEESTQIPKPQANGHVC